MISVGDKISHYVLKKEIGSGGAGVVFLAEDLNSHKLCVVKVIRRGKGVQEQKAIEAEIKVGLIIGKGCLNLVQYMEFVPGDNECCIIMEYCSKGDVGTLIAEHKAANKNFTEEEISCFFFGATSGLNVLHTANIVHRDIKPTNIFTTESFVVKVGDYSIARQANTTTTTIMGGSAYTPPEILNGDNTLSPAQDMYALGCIVVEMIDLCHPFCNKSNNVQLGRVLAGTPNPAPDTLSPVVSTIRECALTLMAVDPFLRPTSRALLQNPVLRFAHLAVENASLRWSVSRCEKELKEQRLKTAAGEKVNMELQKKMAALEASLLKIQNDQSAHMGSKDEMSYQAFLQMKMDESLIFVCSSCNYQIVEDGGANTIACPRCRSVYCYQCRKKLYEGNNSNQWTTAARSHFTAKAFSPEGGGGCYIFAKQTDVDKMLRSQAKKAAEAEWRQRSMQTPQRGTVNNMCIVVRAHGFDFSLIVTAADSIFALKQKVKEKTIVNICDQRLFIGGADSLTLLGDDSMTLNDYGIVDGSRVFMAERGRDK